jgi:hypothetical protein
VRAGYFRDGGGDPGPPVDHRAEGVEQHRLYTAGTKHEAIKDHQRGYGDPTVPLPGS